MGEWQGEGGGDPGQGTGTFTFAHDLDNTIIVRKNHSVYPATKNKPAFTHDDQMTIYQTGNTTRAIYFDNEGHVINYNVGKPMLQPLDGNVARSGERYWFLSSYLAKRIREVEITDRYFVSKIRRADYFRLYATHWQRTINKIRATLLIQLFMFD